METSQKNYYDHSKPELKERTKQRLAEIANCGMIEVAYGQFGYKGITSGLYIEMIWSYSDDDFKEYIDWARELINQNYGTTI
jgi:hypothetical protein